MALKDIIRRTAQVAQDPVLQKWLFRRLSKIEQPPAAFVPHCPPYAEQMLPLSQEQSTASFKPLPDDAPNKSIELSLAGHEILLAPSDNPFDLTFDDLEMTLALHRFAWLPLLGADADPKWVNRLCHLWQAATGEPNDGWAWHPYTASERAINLLDYARKIGMPGKVENTVSVLSQHAPEIANRLEYFGAHNTGNHLANNGRGLYRLGIDLGLPGARDLGHAILVHEAHRLFGASGILREGSTHYHALYVRNYADCWLAAKRAHADQHAHDFAEILGRTVAALRHLTLDQGMPLIGDISPDCPPSFLHDLIADTGPSTATWVTFLAPDERQSLRTLFDGPSAEAETPAIDGWHRLEHRDWQALWHVSPDGWCQMPGHGHQDIGAPEIHVAGVPIFVDPGRGAYGNIGEAALYASSAVHGGIRIDDQDPYPANKPYYSDDFRRHVAGAPPTVAQTEHGLSLVLHGYRRLGVETVTRSWSFAAGGVEIADELECQGRHRVERALVTPGTVDLKDRAATININGKAIHVSCDDNDTEISVEPVKLWVAYGKHTHGSRLVFCTAIQNDWCGMIKIELLG